MILTTSKKTAKEDVQRLELPPLTGSEKQISWADNIRRTAIIDIISEALAPISNEIMRDVEIDDRVIQAVKMYTNATTIIESKNRYHFLNQKLSKII